MTEPPDDDPLIVALRALRADYLSHAPARTAELWSAFDRVQNGDREAAVVLRNLTHRLAGSGGAYGFPAVTDHARAAEQLLDRALPAVPLSADLATLRSLLTAIAAVFDQARALE